MLKYARRTWAEIDLDALDQNYRAACALAGGRRVMPVVKADAYGHGAVEVVKSLEQCGADYFAVSGLDEACQLRASGVKANILILGYTAPEDFPKLISLDITQTVMDAAYAAALSDAGVSAGCRVRVHIKADTGMARLGFDARQPAALDAAADEIVRVSRLPGLFCEGIFTHFATSDEPRMAEFAEKQLALFRGLLSRIEERGVQFSIPHTSNSGAIFSYPAARFEMVRLGISLYGMYPGTPETGVLKPVMRLVTTVAQVHSLRVGEPVSYGCTYVADSDRTVAVLTAGYADGYPRLLSGRASVTIRGRRCPVLGRVCMDQMIVDVSGVDGVRAGDEAVLFGGNADEPSAGELAEMIGTIHYELFCGISARVPRVYLRGGVVQTEHSYIV